MLTSFSAEKGGQMEAVAKKYVAGRGAGRGKLRYNKMVLIHSTGAWHESGPQLSSGLGYPILYSPY